MDKIEVKLAQRCDIKDLAKIQTESWEASFNMILSSETLQECTNLERCTTMLESVFDSNVGNLYIAYLNGEPCAELFWYDAGKDMPGYVEIVALHSLKKSWGKGVGKAIMDKALTDILKSGKNNIFLWVFKDNIRARKFYEKCGFKADGTEKISNFDNAVEVRYVR